MGTLEARYIWYSALGDHRKPKMAISVGRKKFQLRRRKGGKKSPASPSPSPPWVELPGDVTSNILQRLGAVEILKNAQKVCTTWRRVCEDPAMWRVVDMADAVDLLYDPYDLDVMCRQAVDRSQGQLIDINIEYFADDDLLRFVCQRSKHLKRLRIACCNNVISSTGLREAVKNLAELEELHLYFMSSIVPMDIESIGTSCPKLKSLTFNNRAYKFPYFEVDNSYALAIAKSMPNLCHLSLIGNKMTNEGLEAILNCCPQLESLDIRQCFNVEQRDDVWKRCYEKIKLLRTPCDSTEDYEWDSKLHDYESSDSDSFYGSYYDYEYYDYDDFSREYYNDDMGLYYGYNYF